MSCEALPSFVIRILVVVTGRGRSGSHVTTGRIQNAGLHTTASDNIICLRNWDSCKKLTSFTESFSPNSTSLFVIMKLLWPSNSVQAFNPNYKLCYQDIRVLSFVTPLVTSLVLSFQRWLHVATIEFMAEQPLNTLRQTLDLTKQYSRMDTGGCFTGDKASGAWSWPLTHI
jgi:hypothetical protein